MISIAILFHAYSCKRKQDSYINHIQKGLQSINSKTTTDMETNDFTESLRQQLDNSLLSEQMYRNRFQSCESLLKKKEAEVDEYESKVSLYESEIDELTANLEQCKAENIKIIEESERNNFQRERELTNSKQSLADYAIGYVRASSNRNPLDTGFTEFVKSFDKFKSEKRIDTFKQAIDNINTRTEENYRNLKGELKEKEHALEIAMTGISEQSKEIEILKVKLGTVDDITQKVYFNSSREIGDLRRELDNCKEENNKLKETSKNVCDLWRQISSLKEENENLKNDCSRLHAINTELTEKLERCQYEYKTEKDKLTDVNDMLRRKIIEKEHMLIRLKSPSVGGYSGNSTPDPTNYAVNQTYNAYPSTLTNNLFMNQDNDRQSPQTTLPSYLLPDYSRPSSVPPIIHDLANNNRSSIDMTNSSRNHSMANMVPFPTSSQQYQQNMFNHAQMMYQQAWRVGVSPPPILQRPIPTHVAPMNPNMWYPPQFYHQQAQVEEFESSSGEDDQEDDEGDDDEKDNEELVANNITNVNKDREPKYSRNI
ncbi:hypothetical protein GJ496_000147 [Pomphorhynchus laevis]|nr:hypothetical protein GJ496_000147 [Pomphorhynchus laevis]